MLMCTVLDLVIIIVFIISGAIVFVGNQPSHRVVPVRHLQLLQLRT